MLCRSKNSAFKPLALYLVVYFGLLTLLPNLANTHLQWNWLGKGAALAWSLLFITLYPTLTFNNCRITLQQATPTYQRILPWLLVCYGLCCLVTALFSLANSSLETLIFQATLPGLDEEMAFRGIVLTLLLTQTGRACAQPSYWHYGAAIVSSALLFALAHGISLTTPLGIQLAIHAMIIPFVMGCGFAAIALHSRSLLIPVLLHNSLNLVSLLQ